MWLGLGDYRGPATFHAFVRYCEARFRRENVAKAFMSYVGDNMYLQPNGQYIGAPFSRIFEERSDFDAQSVIDDITARVTGEG